MNNNRDRIMPKINEYEQNKKELLERIEMLEKNVSLDDIVDL